MNNLAPDFEDRAMYAAGQVLMIAAIGGAVGAGMVIGASPLIALISSISMGVLFPAPVATFYAVRGLGEWLDLKEWQVALLSGIATSAVSYLIYSYGGEAFNLVALATPEDSLLKTTIFISSVVLGLGIFTTYVICIPIVAAFELLLAFLLYKQDNELPAGSYLPNSLFSSPFETPFTNHPSNQNLNSAVQQAVPQITGNLFNSLTPENKRIFCTILVRYILDAKKHLISRNIITADQLNSRNDHAIKAVIQTALFWCIINLKNNGISRKLTNGQLELNYSIDLFGDIKAQNEFITLSQILNTPTKEDRTFKTQNFMNEIRESLNNGVTSTNILYNSTLACAGPVYQILKENLPGIDKLLEVEQKEGALKEEDLKHLASD